MTWRISRNGQLKTKYTLYTTIIDQLSHYKLLGLITDKDLSFEAHIDELSKKLSKRLRLLRHISPYLKQSHKLTFYLATIKPVMLYLSPKWSSCNKELLERILDAERATHTSTMFNELNCIPFFIETYISRCSIAFKRIEGTTPDYINSILKTNSEIHNRSTRFANLNFHCPVFKKNTEGGQTFSVWTIRNWNELSMDVKKVKNVKSFKKKLYTILITNQKEKVILNIF